MSIWIQIHGLPLDRMTRANATGIGQAIGPLLTVEFHASDGVCSTKFFRVKVAIDTRKQSFARFPSEA